MALSRHCRGVSCHGVYSLGDFPKLSLAKTNVHMHTHYPVYKQSVLDTAPARSKECNSKENQPERLKTSRKRLACYSRCLRLENVHPLVPPWSCFASMDGRKILLPLVTSMVVLLLAFE